MVHIYSGILFSHKKEQNNAIHSHIDATRDYHIEVSQKQKDNWHMIYMWNYMWNIPILHVESQMQHR